MIRTEREEGGRVGCFKSLVEVDDHAMLPTGNTDPGDINGIDGAHRVIEAGSVDREVLQDAKSVLVVGAGPAGLMLASTLTRFGIDVEIVDDRPDKTATGRADGLQPKSIETLRQLGLLDSLLRRGVKIFDICYWNSTSTSPLSRTGRGIHYPETVDTLDPFVLLVHQGMIEDVFLEDMKTRGVEVFRNSPFVSCAAEGSKKYIVATCEDLTTGKYRTIQSKYVVGCDGAHSRVRKSMAGVEMVGESGKAAWGVLDGVIKTDFPDLWSKVVIHSETAGSILLIPRERNMTRLYIELHPGTIPPTVDEIANQDFVISRAKEIMEPFKVEWKSIEWFSVYRVGQRIASHFSNHSLTTFIVGDAAHTHSPKAAQGMNVSMHDSLNLSWKLSLTLRALALPSLLATYESERRQIAQELLDFDFGHANAYTAGDTAAIAQDFDTNVQFISGVGAEYALNTLNRDVAGNPPRLRPGRLRAGALLPPARATRYIDANPVHLQLDIPLLCQFRIYFFAASVHASAEFLGRLCVFIASESSVLGRATRAAKVSYATMPVQRTKADEYLLPERYTASSRLFTPALVTTMPKKDVEISDLPPLLRFSPWTFYLDDGSPRAGGCTEKWLGGLAGGEVVLVNVRPDGYVGSIGRWDPGQEAEAEAWLNNYYGGFLRS